MIWGLARDFACATSLALMLAGVSAQDRFRGMCDASAAAALGQSHFVVADDEGDVLRIYRRGSETPVRTVDLIDHLRNRKPNGKNAEADIEGAARIGQRIYWISSHARKGADGEADPHRQRFFATDIVSDGKGPTVQAAAGGPYIELLQDLTNDARFALLTEAARRKPEADGGLNIEGLAATANGDLLIGFRNPLSQGRALIIPLLNGREVIDNATKPKFGELIRLDLGGRGIRSMARVGNELLIAAGPIATAAESPVQPAFALFRWSGIAAQAAQFIQALDSGSFRAEAMVADVEPGELLLFSDDGDETVGSRDCKSNSVPLEEKFFRARTLPLPLGNGASSCRVDKVASFAGETLRLARSTNLPATASLGLFRAPLAVNTDGAPTSYNPDDYKGERLAINHIDNGIAIRASNGGKLTLAQRMAVFDHWRQSGTWQVPAGSSITWQNVIAAVEGKPCVFQKGPYAGYFGSLTALKNGLSGSAAGECSVNDQLDQRMVPATVLRGGANPLRAWGAEVGDLVLAINPATGVMVPAIIGDSGNGDRVGEGSVALNRALITGARMPETYRQALALDTGARDMVIAVLPASRAFQLARPYNAENIGKRVQAWAETHGYGGVPGLGAAALECASGL